MTLREISVALAERAEDVCRELLSGGSKSGHEWFCGDVSGIKGESMHVELDGERRGLWHDHATGLGGDILDLVAQHNSTGLGEAAKWGAGFLNVELDSTPVDNPAVFDPLKWSWTDKKTGLKAFPSKAWPYHDAAGQIIGYAARFDYPDGRKDVMPIRMWQGKWQWKGWKAPEKRPLFNYHLLCKSPNAPVLVVEGEKTAVAAGKLFPDHIVTTPQGGSQSFQKADWSILNNRPEIVLWPDADAAGRGAMNYLKSRFPDARLIETKNLPDGWDLADDPPPGFDPKGAFDGASAKPSPPPKAPFRCLGYQDDVFYYLSYRNGAVVSLRPSEHTELPLQMIAPDSYWKEVGLWADNSAGVDWKAVAKYLFSKQFEVGVYNEDNVRGLGCWVEDSGRTIVYHAGDRLIVNGKTKGLFQHPTKFIYPRRRKLEVQVEDRLSVDDIAPLLEACELMPWSSPMSAWILPSILFLAPICGALDYRPMAQLSGASGSGKSWVFTNFVTPMVGPCVAAVSVSTAAGIRQAIGCDALTVLGDEFESKDQSSRDRMSDMHEVMRSSSTETGAQVFKGSPSGHAKRYNMRSIWIISAIASGAIEIADENRLARLELKIRKDPDAFRKLEQLAFQTALDPKFTSAWVARSIWLAGHVRTACKIFRECVQSICGDGRKAQQYGTLLAGRWFLSNDCPPTKDQAMAMAQEFPWQSVQGGSDEENDSARAINLLLQHKIDILDANGRPERRNIGEALSIYYADGPPAPFAYAALLRSGIHPVHNAIDIANRHSELQRIFANSQFADRWSEYFKRIEGAGICKFTPVGAKTVCAVRVPRSYVVQSETELEL